MLAGLEVRLSELVKEPATITHLRHKVCITRAVSELKEAEARAIAVGDPDPVRTASRSLSVELTHPSRERRDRRPCSPWPAGPGRRWSGGAARSPGRRRRRKQGVMNYTIFERGRRNQTTFGFMDMKAGVFPGTSLTLALKFLGIKTNFITYGSMHL